jgi:hypothetical protein
LPIQSKIPVSTGPVHGAAMRPLTAELGELVVQARGEHEVERAEHRRREREEHDGHEREHPWVRERGAEEAPRVAGDDAERREHRRDPQHEGRREPHRVQARLALSGPEDAHRDGDHRIDARREAHEQTAEKCREAGGDRAAGETAFEDVRLGGERRARVQKKEQEHGHRRESARTERRE